MDSETRSKLNGILENGISINTSGCGLGFLAKQACDFLNENFRTEGVYAEIYDSVYLDLYHVLKTEKVATIFFNESGVSFSDDTEPENFALVTLQFKDMIVHMKKLTTN